MNFTIENTAPAVITLSGDVLGGAEAMEFSGAVGELIRSGAREVVVDLTGVDLMNSSGLGMLVGASTSLRSSQGRLMVAGANERILGLLKMTRLDSVFATYASREEALAACGQTC
jgi:anti-sigma B factor antagonist